MVSSRPLVVLIAAHPIWNVPPFFNAARLLARNGYQVIVIGYQQGDLPQRERICDHAVVLRLAIRSRNIPVGPIRKLCSLVELLSRCRRIISRLQPVLVTVFNDPASLLLRHLKKHDIPSICWLLEYPEVDHAGRLEGALLKFCQRSWQRADTLVVPNYQRLALHLGQRPECQQRPCFVVHNAPPGDSDMQKPGSAAVGAIDAVRRARGKGDTVVVYSGAVGIRYGIQTMLKAVLQADNLFLLILGKQHSLAVSEVSEIVPDYETNDKVRWINEIPYRDLAAVLKECDIGFVHYIGENLNTRFSAPGKLYEYMRAGLVVFTDAAQEVAPLLRAAGAGEVLPRGFNAEDLSVRLQKYSQGSRILSEAKENATGLYQNVFRLEVQFQPLLDHIRELTACR